MPRDGLSTDIVEAMMARDSGHVTLDIAIIEHDDLSPPLRIVNNQEDIVVSGYTYTACGFEFKPPDDKDTGMPLGRITMNNTDLWLTPTIRALSGEYRITVKRVSPTNLTADPPVFNTIETTMQPMTLTSIQYDKATVRGQLSHANLNKGYPGDKFSPLKTPGVF